ncbi:fibronectin type III domain-containing protein [Aquimarina sp. LLG6339-5]|uniref:fibronectin type III domain-containing protein n=1 Tax=Aquimarina sp. LLG6339-5 TaxID=3160830 RepID=UPI003868B61C
MKKNNFLYLFLVIGLIIISCKNDDDLIVLPQNQNPGNFLIGVSQVTANSSLLNWDAAIDPDGDNVSYEITLNGTEIASSLTDTEYLLEELSPNTNYSGTVIASDGNNGATQSTFSFTSAETTGDMVAIAWEKSFGGSEIDIAYSIALTTDGGYVIAGGSNSDDGDVGGNNDADGFLGGDFWVIKLNGSGDLLWETNIGGSANDDVYSIQQTSDGGYIATGSSNSQTSIDGSPSFFDFWVIKLDASGNVIWENNYGGSGNEGANSINETSDGGYIVAGFAGSSDGNVSGNNGMMDFWIIKIDSLGALEWEKNFGGSEFDIANSIEQTNDGGYIVGGYTESFDGDVSNHYGDRDYWIIKLDPSGNLVWEKSLGGTLEDFANDVHQTMDNGYIVAGFSESSDFDVSNNNGKKDMWIVKLNSSGEIVWETSLGSSESDSGQSIQQTMDQGYVVAGYSGASDGDVSTNNGGYRDYWIVKLSDLGELSWEISVGGPEPDYANAIQQTNDGYIVTGYVQGPGGDISGSGKGKWDYWVVKLE